MVAEEWYRTADWSPAAQEDFERRLARARSWSRSQYLKIKALGLPPEHRADAQRLWQRAIDCAEFEIDRWHSIECLAASLKEEDPARAEALFRQLIHEDPDLNGTSGMAHIDLAELLLATPGESALAEARALLNAWWAEQRSPFPASRYRYFVCRLKLAIASGDHLAARDLAAQALEAAGAQSPFARHRNVGLAHAEADELQWLEGWVNPA
ncbi:hypothetical protein ATK74_0254 [Propionicimonas paludicola]|uniref:Tetratricopeptide repeat protein n=1 Tax=Propionicimonas paludicola TaxID=185243 RepID=A0A2A9CMT5_9ACTN|nr:hypothetical protein ATK74_0254 [Propionicimonas paludicola]